MPRVSSSVRKKRQEIWEKRRNRRLNIIIGLLLVALIAESIWVASESRYFNVRKIIIQGNKRIPARKILKLSGLSKNSNFFRVSLRQVERNIRKEVWIKKVKARRKLPLNIEIVVEEREPLAVVALSNSFALVDKDRKVLEVSRENIWTGLPLIRDLPDLSGFHKGELISSQSLANALSCLTDLDKGLVSNLSFISAPSVDELKLCLKSGLLIFYGESNNNPRKNRIIKAVLADAQSRGEKLLYIDVRTPSNPATMPVSSQ